MNTSAGQHVCVSVVPTERDWWRMEDHVVLCPQLKRKVESPARAVTHKVLFINNDT